MKDSLQNTMTAEKRSLLRNYDSLLRLAAKGTSYATADMISKCLNTNPEDFRNSCKHQRDRIGFPVFTSGEARQTVKIPIVPFIQWITGIQTPTIYETIELIAMGAVA
jgi:hypothetical protein